MRRNHEVEALRDGLRDIVRWREALVCRRDRDSTQDTDGEKSLMHEVSGEEGIAHKY